MSKEKLIECNLCEMKVPIELTSMIAVSDIKGVRVKRMCYQCICLLLKNLKKPQYKIEANGLLGKAAEVIKWKNEENLKIERRKHLITKLKKLFRFGEESQNMIFLVLMMIL